jgi:molybdopterin synthase sulfur carrier subunit
VSTVRIPPVLRSAAGGVKSLDVKGSTVGEVLEGLTTAHPSLRSQLFSDGGELNRFVNVYVNEQDVRYLQESATPVDDRDTIIILPAMAGGSNGRPLARPLPSSLAADIRTSGSQTERLARPWPGELAADGRRR